MRVYVIDVSRVRNALGGRLEKLQLGKIRPTAVTKQQSSPMPTLDGLPGGSLLIVLLSEGSLLPLVLMVTPRRRPALRSNSFTISSYSPPLAFVVPFKYVPNRKF